MEAGGSKAREPAGEEDGVTPLLIWLRTMGWIGGSRFNIAVQRAT